MLYIEIEMDIINSSKLAKVIPNKLSKTNNKGISYIERSVKKIILDNESMVRIALNSKKAQSKIKEVAEDFGIILEFSAK